MYYQQKVENAYYLVKLCMKIFKNVHPSATVKEWGAISIFLNSFDYRTCTALCHVNKTRTYFNKMQFLIHYET